MASVASICNLALVPLGADRIITITEDTEQARKCNAIYESVRNDEMSAHPWNFATTRIALALSSTTPTYEYSYAHQLPSDSLRIIQLEDQENCRIEGDKVLSNSSSVKCTYIKLITDANSFSPQFISVLAARMAYELAFALTDSSSAIERLYNIYQLKVKRAKAIDAQEGSPYQLIGDRWIDARSGSVR